MINSSLRRSGSVFAWDGVPPVGQMVPLGLQHVVAAVVGVVTPAMMIADVCGLGDADETVLIQAALLISALATLLQIFSIGPLGARLPVIMGVSFAYVPTLQAIGGEFGLSTVLGAQVIGGLVAVVFGLFVKPLRVLFPPLITGTVIFTIGLSLYPTAVRYMAGGADDPRFGSPQNWAVALLTLAVVIGLSHFARGFAKLASILIGMIVGYAAALLLGMVSFEAVGTAELFHAVPPLRFGLRFEWSAVVSMAIMYIVNSVQAIGDLSSTTAGGMDRQPTDRELSGGIIANGLASVAGALFGGLPTATYSQNVGIVTVNRVINRAVFAFAALVLLVAGFVPKIAAALTTIPQCVIGGATISVFASITMTGIKMLSQSRLTPRNTAVAGIAVALGVGVTQSPGCLGLFPTWVRTVFGGSSVVIATLVAIALNLTLPRDPEEG